jgi:hypothetical protein
MGTTYTTKEKLAKFGAGVMYERPANEYMDMKVSGARYVRPKAVTPTEPLRVTVVAVSTAHAFACASTSDRL